MGRDKGPGLTVRGVHDNITVTCGARNKLQAGLQIFAQNYFIPYLSKKGGRSQLNSTINWFYHFVDLVRDSSVICKAILIIFYFD